MTTKVYKYGALPPEKESAIRQQMKLSRDYYNKLVETENKRRTEIWGGEKPQWPHEPVETTDDETESKKITYCKCDQCEKYYHDVIDKYKRLPFLDKKPIRAEAVKNGLYWGTYLIAEQAFDAAVKKTKCFSLVKYRSWKKGGYAGVQVQLVSKPGTKYKIEHADDPRAGRRKGQRHMVYLRVGSDEKQQPIWSDPIKFEMHRPIYGRVTWIKICMHYRGEREIWSIDITCSDIPDREDKSNNGVVAVDVGWRVLEDDKLRIAFATGIDEKESEFKLCPEWRELSARADRIRSYRDNRFGVLKIAIPKLKILKKPSSLKLYLEKNEMMTDELSAWCRQDRHLAQYEIGCRRRSEDKRRNDMRVWLRGLRRKYAHVVIKNSSHKEMKDHKKAIESGMMPPQRRNAHHAAPGEVIGEICKVWDRKTEVSIIKAENTTATCLCCGHLNHVGPEQFVVCEQCGTTEDRDRISTRNLLILYARGECEKPTARKTTAKFAKKHKNISEVSECQRSGL